MQINDEIYGTFEITEPVLIELINSPSMQRLKGISQQGLPEHLYYTKCFSRYDHSVGVMLILKKTGASVEEQVAGLLHDVSHTAFSHVVDWVVGDQEKENFQDNNHVKYINKSELPGILEKHGYSVERISDHDAFTLLETDAPKLCADRLDYTLRDFFAFGWSEKAMFCADKIIAYDGALIFSEKEAASLFGYGYMKMQIEHWGSAQSGVRYKLFSNAIKIALDDKVIEFADLWQDDAFVMKKLVASDDLELKKIIDILRESINLVSVDKHPQFVFKKKFRWVDPEFLENGEVRTFSQVDEEYAELIEKEREKSKNGFKVSLR